MKQNFFPKTKLEEILSELEIHYEEYENKDIVNFDESMFLINSEKSYGLESTEKQSDVDEDEDELIKLELLELEEPDEQPIEVSDDESEPNSSKKMNKNLIKPQ